MKRVYAVEILVKIEIEASSVAEAGKRVLPMVNITMSKADADDVHSTQRVIKDCKPANFTTPRS